jgi:hypothetical protein
MYRICNLTFCVDITSTNKLLPDVSSVRELSPQYGPRSGLTAAATGARCDYGSFRPPMNR